MKLDACSQNSVEGKDVVLRKHESQAAVKQDWAPWAVANKVRRLLVAGGREVWPTWDTSLSSAGEDGGLENS